MRVASCLILLGVALQWGCGSATTQTAAGDDLRLRLLGRLYGEFIAQHNGKPPANESQLIDHLAKSADMLKSQGIADVEQLLVSPRDGQPLVVLYGESIIQDENSGFPWIAHETLGIGGKKLVIGARGNVEEMTQEQIEALAKR